MKKLFDGVRMLHPKQIEAIGIAIVLMAALWEALVIRDLTEIFNQAEFVEIEHKLARIWLVMTERQDFKDFFTRYNYINRFPELKKANWLNFFASVRLVLFAFGSILVVSGKWMDAKSK